MSECYQVEKVLWDLRHDSAMVSRLADDAVETLRSYGLTQEEQDAMIGQDFQRLIQLGVNPILLYFGALEMGVPRSEYYAKLNEVDNGVAGGGNG